MTHVNKCPEANAAIFGEDVYLQNFNMDSLLPFDNMEEPERKCDMTMLYQYHRDVIQNLHLQSMQSQQQQNQSNNLEKIPPDMSIPSRDEFPGNLNFQLLLNNQMAGKYWVYSPTLSKVFINMEQTLPLTFKWEPPQEGLWLRAVMMFSLEQYRSDPVHRCLNHMAATDRSNINIDNRQIRHVFRCLNPASMYEDRGGHLSVIAPLGLPQAGSQHVPMHFQFFCKNSCTSGMNRRPTELIFTLENDEGRVLGRRRLGVRICSCPKRDKEKEEAEARYASQKPGSKKRKLSIPPGKKLMVPHTDLHPQTVQFSVPGKELYQAVMTAAYNILAGHAVRSGQFDFFKPYMDEIVHKMQ
ncbi:cellular tumor antigen p53 [Orussus abietinus]|uniref:cellular tumor antigen p53 n=1 Tax=Orussus abietinus TaxID=222816 RepID=UPI00062697E9|nr:cellular tumor antigen p53 [Orussus abietinus]